MDKEAFSDYEYTELAISFIIKKFIIPSKFKELDQFLCQKYNKI